MTPSRPAPLPASPAKLKALSTWQTAFAFTAPMSRDGMRGMEGKMKASRGRKRL